MKQYCFGSPQIDFHHFVEKRPIRHSSLPEAMV
uniref:Uncharacterized protein n=1 Tax=Arundo donax TaxID=35708 RepID=A0A0A9EGB9_ARUDO